MLRDDLLRRRDGLRFCGLTPSKRGQDPDKVRGIVERQAHRIAALAPDGLVLYDLQDDAGLPRRRARSRSCPRSIRSTTRRDYLAALDVPRVLYKSVGNLTAAELLAWADVHLSTSANGPPLLVSPISASA